MKSKPIIIIISAFAIIIVIALIILMILASSTNLFKSPKELFEKSFQENKEKLYSILNFSNEKEYLANLQKEDYEENTNMQFKYKNSQNNYEFFNMQILGKTNNKQENSYKKINLKYGENTNIANIEFFKEKENTGVFFEGNEAKCLKIDTTNKNETLKTLNIGKDPIEEIIQKYKITNIKNFINKSEELKKVIEKYLINENKYIELDKRNIELINGDTKILKGHETILSSSQAKRLLRDLANLIEDSSFKEYASNLKNEMQIILFVDNEKIDEIYIKIDTKILRIDLYEKGFKILYNDPSNEKQLKISIEMDNQNKKIIFEDNLKNSMQILFSTQSNMIDANIIFEKENQVINEIHLLQQLTIKENVKIEKSILDMDIISLKDIEEREANIKLSEWINRINQILEKVQNDNINSELLAKWIKYNKEWQDKIQTRQISLASRFNNQFLLFQGKNVSKEVIYNMMDVVEKNIYGYKVNNKNEIKIYLQEGNEDLTVSKKLKNVVKDAKSNYNVNFEFDNSGKISVILLELYENKEKTY